MVCKRKMTFAGKVYEKKVLIEYDYNPENRNQWNIQIPPNAGGTKIVSSAYIKQDFFYWTVY